MSALALHEVSNNCYHAVREGDTLFIVWPYPGGRPRYGANRHRQSKCVATADNLREMLAKLQALANDIL